VATRRLKVAGVRPIAWEHGRASAVPVHTLSTTAMPHSKARCHPRSHRLDVRLLAAAALTVGAIAWPSSGRGAEPPSEAAPAKGAASRPASTRHPMDALREKLAAKLGAAKTTDASSPYLVKLASKTEAAPAAPATRSRTSERTAATVAALRTEKAAGEPSARSREVAWSYEGDGGPESWGRLRPEYARCANGSRQSPIDIQGGIGLDLEPIRFDYRVSGFAVTDNGHTVQVNLGAGNAIEVMGRRYELEQFHFHRPSEERVAGRRFDMVAHLEHRDAEGRLAVVAVLLGRGAPHPLVQAVWNNLPLEKGEALAARVTIDLNELLPRDGRYYTFMGSQTTPPCSEGVLWLVMQQPVQLSMEQIAIFARLYPMNARPVQAASGRMIKQSN